MKYKQDFHVAMLRIFLLSCQKEGESKKMVEHIRIGLKQGFLIARYI